MKKIYKVYNGYMLENGDMYRIVEIRVNKYQLVKITNFKDYLNFDYEMLDVYFDRVKQYKEYLKSLL